MMNIFESIDTFMDFFVNNIIKPFFDLLNDHFILGYPIWEWLLGYMCIVLAVRFIKAFFGLGFHSDKNED